MEVCNTMYASHVGNVCTYLVHSVPYPKKNHKRNPFVHKGHNSKSGSAVVKVTISHWLYCNYLTKEQ